jgi:4'-phosphopantetheinyl transferase
MNTECSWFYPPELLRLLPEHVHIWRMSTDIHEKHFFYLQGVLSEDEQRRAAKFHFDRDRVRYTVARGCLRMICAYYSDSPPEAFRFVHNKYGKPRLDGTLGNINFNLSHSHKIIVYGFAYGREIGIDVEEIDTSKDSGRLLDHVFSESEKRDYMNIPETKKLEAFYTCWSRKEAYIKARGKGLSIPLDSFSVTVDPDEIPRLISADPESETSGWFMNDIKVAPGYSSSVVVSGTEPYFHYLDAIGLFRRRDHFKKAAGARRTVEP